MPDPRAEARETLKDAAEKALASWHCGRVFRFRVNVALGGIFRHHDEAAAELLRERDELQAELAQVRQERDKWLKAFNESEQFQSGPTARAEQAWKTKARTP